MQYHFYIFARIDPRQRKKKNNKTSAVKVPMNTGRRDQIAKKEKQMACHLSRGSIGMRQKRREKSVAGSRRY